MGPNDPTIILCATHIWAPRVLLYFQIKLPRKRHMGERPSQKDLRRRHVSQKRHLNHRGISSEPVLVVEGHVVSGIVV